MIEVKLIPLFVQFLGSLEALMQIKTARFHLESLCRLSGLCNKVMKRSRGNSSQGHKWVKDRPCRNRIYRCSLME